MTLGHFSKILGASLIFSGTCIGAGMLSLPLQTALSGFFPTIVTFIFIWLIMLAAGFLLIEVNLWLKDESNIISMAGVTLGKPGEIIAWVSYLLIMYAANTAYIDAGSPVLTSISLSVLNFYMPVWVSAIILSLVGGIIVYLGTTYVDGINRLLMFGLFLACFILIIISLGNVNSRLLLTNNPKHVLGTLPIIVSSFTAHMVLPSLRTYLHGSLKSLKLVVIIGCTFPLLLYLVWELITLGVVPLSGENGLLAISNSKDPIVRLNTALLNITQSGWVSFLFASFSGLALATSFLGITLSLSDFLRDGLNLKSTNKNHALCIVLAILPSLFIKLTYSKLFNQALNYAGAFIGIMLILLPALMAYSGRYCKKIAHGYQVKGGKSLLLLLSCVGVLVVIAQILSRVGILS